MSLTSQEQNEIKKSESHLKTKSSKFQHEFHGEHSSEDHVEVVHHLLVLGGLVIKLKKRTH